VTLALAFPYLIAEASTRRVRAQARRGLAIAPSSAR
jgi:hypothetical protein